MAQWFAAKAEHPDALLFFRMGDFYELFFADAERAAAALDIQLTQRGSHAGRPIHMCGVPVHAADAYLARLIRRGFRVAIAEQTEDPRQRKPGAKTPLKRAVVRLVTPGTLTEETLLDPARANLLLALTAQGTVIGAAWIDISAGRFETECLTEQGLPALLGRLDPSEILAPPELDLGDWRSRRAPHDLPDDQASRDLHAEIAGHPSLSDIEASAAAHALGYIRFTQSGVLPCLPPPRPAGLIGRLQIDAATRQSLEITAARDGGSQHSLLACIRRTLTPPGARLLAEHLAAPLTDVVAIAERQAAWHWLLTATDVLDALRAALRHTPDMARALGRLSLGRGSPRDLAALRDGQEVAAALAAVLHRQEDPPLALTQARRALDLPPDLLDTLRAALADPAPARLEEGDTIAPGFDGELDALRHLRDHSRAALAGLQLDLAQRHGVASLKIRHHQQLGYVVEVPTAVAERLRAAGLILRQSTATGARFSDPDLAALDQRITEAGSQAAARERGLFAHLVQLATAAAGPLGEAAAAIACIDVAQSSATLAASGRWCRPVVDDSAAFCIEAGRHPVVEAALPAGSRFIANDTDLSPARRLLLLTGPNMAGKSTYLRQNALIVILAQAGLPVPAAAAQLGVADRLFCRVGASDDLARGRSTFMVEMTEAAIILTQATARSVVVIDEIGRGTATLDGLAIAWAMLEALHNQLRARAIFATHFHELARLRHELPHLCPHTMRVKEWKGDVVFLHEVAAGAGGRSWGVQVARLAGVPGPVVKRAGVILQALETRGAGLTQDVELPLFADVPGLPPESGVGVEHPPARAENEAVAALAALDPDQLTPKEALDALYRLKALAVPGGEI